ncbi:uncharacterized protein [Nicotiana tomentosiformis]|uniref:uncharacterized protein n=1 Tax=Nicotiana tomentosiformis TaxID=4098 RepID=UPI00388C3692
MKEKSSVKARRIEELEARLASILAKAESDTEQSKADADALMAVYRADAEVAQAISRFRVDFSQCEVELHKVSGEKDSLRLLYNQKDEAIKDLQANLAKAREEEAELDTVEPHSVKQNGSAQAKKIEELEAQLAEAKAEVESSKILADKSIAVYRADVEAKDLEAEAEALASNGDDDDDGDSNSGSEHGGEPDREANVPDDDQEA